MFTKSGTNFNERFEIERTFRIREGVNDIKILIEKIVNDEIKLSSKKIHSSMRNLLSNTVEKYSDMYLDNNGNFLFNNEIELLKLILSSNDNFATKMILDMVKDPLRQNLSEEMQKSIAEESGILMNKNYPETYLLNGEIRIKDNISKKKYLEKTKSFDFKIISIDDIPIYHNVFTLNKYNKWIGGSTDNVFDEVNKFCSNAKQYIETHDDNTQFVIILDGNYWDINRVKLDKYSSDKLIIIKTDDINSLKEFIIKKEDM